MTVHSLTLQTSSPAPNFTLLQWRVGDGIEDNMKITANDQHCLQWRTCQTKSDVSALLLLLNYTALQRQPPAIEAMRFLC